MKHEIEIDDEFIFQRVREDLNQFARISAWGEVAGSSASILTKAAQQQAREQLAKIDLEAVIQQEIKASLMPTLKEVVRKQIEAEAKKQVKLAMSQRSEA